MPNIGKRTTHRHDRACSRLHFNICVEIGVKLDDEHWDDHVPKSVETNHEIKITIMEPTSANRHSYF
jgi:hypothetical protein